MQYIFVDRRELDRGNCVFDEMHACIVVARDVDHAREVASTHAYGEGPEVWYDPKRASVQVVGPVPAARAQEAGMYMDCLAS